VVAGHREHIADPSGLQLGSQGRVGAIDLIASHPGGRHTSVQRPTDHGLGQGRLGGKPDPLGDAGRPAAAGVSDPASGHIQLPVNHGVPSIAGIHQVDGDLGVLDPAGGAGVLALHPNGGGALLEIPGLVDHQHRLGIAQVLHQVPTDVVADPVVVPHRPAEQVLHPIRGEVAGVLGDRPAVLARQVRQ